MAALVNQNSTILNRFISMEAFLEQNSSILIKFSSMAASSNPKQHYIHYSYKQGSVVESSTPLCIYQP